MGEKESNRGRTRAILILTNLISLGCLVWTVRDVHLSQLRDDLATMKWGWVAVAVVADIAVYFWQAWRWSLILRPVTDVPYLRVVRAVYVGLFANEILPLRAGEVLRCYMVGRWSGLPFSVTGSSWVIERIFDGIWLCLCLVIMLRYTPVPRQIQYLVDAGYILGFLVLAGAVLLGFAMFRRQPTRAIPPPDRWHRHLAVLVQDLGMIGHSRYLALAFVQSLPYLLLQVIPIWAAFLGYGFDLSLYAAFVLLVILRLGSVVPQAAGNLGLFQLLTTACLSAIFGQDKAVAARFSLVLWGIVTLPLLAGGAVALAVTGAKFSELRKAAQEEANRV